MFPQGYSPHPFLSGLQVQPAPDDKSLRRRGEGNNFAHRWGASKIPSSSIAGTCLTPVAIGCLILERTEFDAGLPRSAAQGDCRILPVLVLRANHGFNSA
jgi:hypothetical protein